MRRAVQCATLGLSHIFYGADTDVMASVLIAVQDSVKRHRAILELRKIVLVLPDDYDCHVHAQVGGIHLLDLVKPGERLRVQFLEFGLVVPRVAFRETVVSAAKKFVKGSVVFRVAAIGTEVGTGMLRLLAGDRLRQHVVVHVTDGDAHVACEAVEAAAGYLGRSRHGADSGPLLDRVLETQLA